MTKVSNRDGVLLGLRALRRRPLVHGVGRVAEVLLRVLARGERPTPRRATLLALPRWRHGAPSRLLSRLGACAVAVIASLVGGPPALAANLVTASPSLYPAFRPNIADYATRCEPGRTVNVSVAAPAGTTVAVDGGPAQSGSFSVRVALAAGQRFRFVVRRPSGVTYHHVRCLPADFPAWQAWRTQLTQSAFHLLTVQAYAMIFDRNGTPVWWWQQEPGIRAFDFKRLPNGDLAWADLYGNDGFAVDTRSRYQQRSLDGRFVREIKAVGVATDHHELVQLPNGNQLVLAYRPRQHVDLSPWGGPADATVLDAEIQELAEGWRLVWSWNSKDHVSPGETPARFLPWRQDPPQGQPEHGYDLVHPNSIESTADGNLLLSARNIDAVLKINRSNGDVMWKLGGTRTPDRLALPAGTQSIGAQHDARELPDGTITLHDNGSFLNRPPRAIRFEINELARTATPVEVVDDPKVARSYCCGSARRLPGGNWVMSWGGSGLVTEFTPSGSRAFWLKFDAPLHSYRDNVIPTGVLRVGALRAGMDAQYPR